MGMTRCATIALAVLTLSMCCADGQAADKRSAAGIFCLLRADSVARPFENLAGQPCWTNPNVQGVSLRSHWNKVEPSEGDFDWSFFDEGVRLAIQHHKKIGMLVTAGVTTPDWVYGAGAYRLNVRTPNQRNGGNGAQPLPWDTEFFSKWSAFVEAFAARYDNVPNLAYVVMGGPGRRGEAYFVDAPEDVAKVESLGGVSRWVQGCERIVDLYARTFHNTPFILATGSPVPGENGKIALLQLGHYGVGKYPGHFGVMSDGLRPHYGMSSVGAQLIRWASNKSPVGFQMLLPYQGGRHMQGGTLEEALDCGLALGGRFFEVYWVDCEDPSQAAVLQRTSARLFGRSGTD
jgi:hypothetical protein